MTNIIMNIANVTVLVSLFLSAYLFSTHTHSHADGLSKAEEYLYGHGIAHCLSHAEGFKDEANRAKGGYCQLGEHGLEAENKSENILISS